MLRLNFIVAYKSKSVFCQCCSRSDLSSYLLTRSSATAEKQRVIFPHGGGLGPPAHSPSTTSGYTYAYGQIRNPQQTYVKRAVH